MQVPLTKHRALARTGAEAGFAFGETAAPRAGNDLEQAFGNVAVATVLCVDTLLNGLYVLPGVTVKEHVGHMLARPDSVKLPTWVELQLPRPGVIAQVRPALDGLAASVVDFGRRVTVQVLLPQRHGTAKDGRTYQCRAPATWLPFATWPEPDTGKCGQPRGEWKPTRSSI